MAREGSGDRREADGGSRCGGRRGADGSARWAAIGGVPTAARVLVRKRRSKERRRLIP